MTKKELLEKAIETVADRGTSYGTPLENFSQIALLWSTILKCPVTPHQVALCNIAIKMARLLRTPDHVDSVVDIAGYAACLAEVQEPLHLKEKM